MNQSNFAQRLIHWLKSRFRKSPPAAPPDEALGRLLYRIETTADVELSCDEVFELLDQYAEMASRGEDVAYLMPLIRHHLETCMDCREEYEALIRVLESPLYSEN
jgi:hypothetical protein